MKTLQNDLTTIEQSKRLIELGVPKNSANHYYGKGGKLRYIDGTIPYSLLWETGCTPCWSAGRLIEIYLICHKSKRSIFRNNVIFVKENISILDRIYNEIIVHIETGSIDFSKLED